jgi:hypothetical protein
MKYKKGSKIGTATIIGDSAASRVANVEYDTCNEPLEKRKAAAFDSSVSIRIISYRSRLIDPDNTSGKAAVDGLVNCGILLNDSYKEVKAYRADEQVKVNSSTEEKTEIVIEAM